MHLQSPNFGGKYLQINLFCLSYLNVRKDQSLLLIAWFSASLAKRAAS